MRAVTTAKGWVAEMVPSSSQHSVRFFAVEVRGLHAHPLNDSLFPWSGGEQPPMPQRQEPRKRREARDHTPVSGWIPAARV